MSTPATAVISKKDQAKALRTEAAALTKEVSELQQKLEPAQRTLDSLQAKRRELAEAGKPGGDLHLKIADASEQVDLLRGRVNDKQARLDTTTASLRELDHEISLDAQREARQARFASLRTQGTDVAARIGEKLRALIEEDLPAFGQVCDSLTSEFINVGGVVNAGAIGPEAQGARALIHQFKGQFFDGPYLAVERRLLRAGWTENEFGPEFIIKTLRPRR